MKNICWAFIFVALYIWELPAQVSYSGGIYAENFNSLASSGTSSNLPGGWAFAESLSNADNTYAANNGSSNAGNTYSYGAIGNPERALGCLASGNLVSIIGASFTNNTSGTITALIISYTGEQWRRGDGSANTLVFAYSTNATSLTNGSWTSVAQLNFTAPITSGNSALDGNAAANRTNILHTITGLNIPANATFWIRWSDTNDIGADDGLAIDDFSLEATVLPIKLLSFSGKERPSSIHLSWHTATEQNNDYMAVERSADGVKFEELGRVKGAGTTEQPQEYRFVDDNPIRGLNYYRLRQVDFDGAFEYHKTISVLFESKGSGLGVQAWPNPAQAILQARWAADAGQPTMLRLFDASGRLMAEHRVAAGAGSFDVPLNALPAGLYFLQVRHGQEVEVMRFWKE